MTETKELENNNLKIRSIKAFFTTVLCVFLVIPLLNFLLDPSGLFFYRERIIELDMASSWVATKQLIDGEETCPNIIFGTSRIMPWDTSKTPDQLCKLSYPAKGLQSFVRDIKTLIKHDVELNKVIVTLGVDAFYNQERYTYQSEASEFLDYPSNFSEKIYGYKTLLYANTLPNIEKTLLEPTVKQLLKKHFRGPNQDKWFAQFRYKWRTHNLVVYDEEWDSEEQRANAIYNMKPQPWVTEYQSYQPETAVKIIKEIIALSKEHQFSVTFIRAPVFTKNIAANDKDEFFDMYKKIANVTDFYDFAYDIKFSKNPSLWIDYTHYRKKVAYLMLDKLYGNSDTEFGKVITKDNVDQHIDLFEQNMYEFFIDVKPHPPKTVIDESWIQR